MVRSTVRKIETAPPVPGDLFGAVGALGLLDAHQLAAASFTPLRGGVSSDIWLVATPSQRFCVKRALARLNVAAVWEAPIERNRYEHQWLSIARAIVPSAVPAVLASDDRVGLFAMEYLEPRTHPVWKTSLLDGVVDPGVGDAVGDTIGRLHAATAGRADIAAAFPTAALFHALRLEPYFEATARSCPDVAEPLQLLSATTASNQLTLVHGDVSPKNILVGPGGPVLLDAECATFGDPAFDVAFCVNHLLLKCLWRRASRSAYAETAHRLCDAYAAHVTWERREVLDARVAALLPGLLLARVDGKSPVDYLDARARDHVRRVVRAWWAGGAPRTPTAVIDAWTAS